MKTGRVLKLLLLLSITTFAALDVGDSLAVRAILDANGLTAVTVNEVCSAGFFLPNNSINNNGRITTLDLHNRQIKVIPADIGVLSYIGTINLMHNEIKTLPSEIGDCGFLSTLELSANLLESLPISIGNFTNLKILNLDSNNLQTLPSTIGNLKKIPQLNLKNNQLTSLPVEIGLMDSLNQLNLRNNNLSSLPIEITKLKSLKVLWVSNNKLTSLPTEIGSLPKLVSLSLDNNKLISLPSSIMNLNLSYKEYGTTYGQLTIHNNNLCDLSTELTTWINTNTFTTVSIRPKDYVLDWKSTQTCNSTLTELSVAKSLQNVVKITPNPFKPNSSIVLSLTEPSFSKISIYNLQGEMVRSIMSGFLNIGTYNYKWDGCDEKGKALSSGSYIIRAHTGDKIFTNRANFLR